MADDLASKALVQPVCPECGGPATVVDRFVLYCTTGPVLHIRTTCQSPHHFAEEFSVQAE
ncbi:hypothetical protein [Kribbella albertanoniae]|uniref:Uncharacterized protein n=1 Tax=Kribbella albertanoniae TaxID=1266829 RepID=A0A4R4QEQ6_9ACTN|nr:hypothetical protein [Kribbella albertanoniae]TDC34007.1 hypothetical protein E1261_04680 [Kribbella albertanoniae]